MPPEPGDAAMTLTFIGRVPTESRRAVRRLVALAPRVTPIRHHVRVFVAPAPVVEGPGGGLGFGAFVLGHGYTDIWMGGKPPSRHVEPFLRDVLAHELAHYEQHRDGKRVQERGVAVRTRTLAKRFKRLTKGAPDARR